MVNKVLNKIHTTKIQLADTEDIMIVTTVFETYHLWGITPHIDKVRTSNQ